ncbi:hypothetical protein QUF80_06665 [Desulfococcaceae bacterium HSG8]|nr:hypothetical protein [Desulfococcaceae bacterium HSG8]
MNEELRNSIAAYLADRVTTFGFAPVERFDKAPEAHHPEIICNGAKTVVVFAITVPRGVFRSPRYQLHAMHRSYHTIYGRLDDIALDVCNFIEATGDALAVPIPSYAPMVFHGMEPWGLLSLKHAAVNAGLGAFGRNGLVHHPVYGTLLRIGAVVTSADLPGDRIRDDFPCPGKCGVCHSSCPSGAFDDEGTFAKLTCLKHTIKHAIYPITLKDEQGLRNIERVINTAGYNYWLECNKCLGNCPNNRLKTKDAGSAFPDARHVTDT